MVENLIHVFSTVSNITVFKQLNDLLHIVFWNQETKERCEQYVAPGLVSSTHLYCDHSTVFFNVTERQEDRYERAFGHRYKFNVLGMSPSISST
jgi:hypothetical protein